MPFPEKTGSHGYPFISAIHQQQNGITWFATTQGLFRYSPADNQWKHFTNNPLDKNSLSYDVLFSLRADPFQPDNYLWIGTNSGGLNRLDLRDYSFIHYTDKDGLPNNVIYGILSDNSGNLWLWPRR